MYINTAIASRKPPSHGTHPPSADLALWQQNYNPLGVGYPTAFPSSESVPEPATLLLLGTGLLTLTGLLRRRAM